ncbi:MAG: hypothetical protein ACRD15_16895 [Vicinamibacterales bacterium]
MTAAELSAASVPPDARVLAVNGRPASTRADTIREIRRRVPVTVLYLQHQGRRFFAALSATT